MAVSITPLAILLASLFSAPVVARSEAPARAADAGPALGLVLEPSAAARLPVVRSAEDSVRPVARLRADWEEIERAPGRYDWTEYEAAVESLRAAGYLVALALVGSHPLYLDEGEVPSPAVEGAIEGWLAFVRSAVRQFHGRIAVVEIGEDLRDAGFDPDTFALVMKQSALAVRAEAAARGGHVWVAQAPIRVEDTEWLAALWERDLSAYIDILPLILDAGRADSVAEAVRAMRLAALNHPPAPAVWAYIHGGGRWDAPAAAVSALAAGATVAAFDLGDSPEERAVWATGVHARIASGYTPAPLGDLRLSYGDSPAPQRAAVLGRFFRESDFTTLAVVRAPALPGRDVRLIVGRSIPRNARAIDPLTGLERRVGSEPVSEGSTDRALRLTSADAPQLVLFEKQRGAPGLVVPPANIEIESARALTAEEIISRHQQVQQLQDDRLDRWTARGRIEYHFRVSQGGAGVDVAIDSNYFWERGGQLEWEQEKYYINGNKVNWKNFPNLPLIQPEKVITLPLDLTLNRTYSYRLVGEATVGDRPAYILEFQPAERDAALNLYRGRIWIDRNEFVRLKLSLLQSDLDPPVLSNEETDRFGEVTGPDSNPYWMFDRIDGQQTWNVVGRTFVVQRQVRFLEYRINPDATEFERRRSAAYASTNKMLRETDRGFRYLERQADGSRVVKEKIDTSQLFVAAGAFTDNSVDSVIPLAGVNYFNYDLWHSDIQLNVLFAGVFTFVTASKPDLAGGKLDLTLDAALSALKGEDNVFAGDVKVEAAAVEIRTQHLALRLGLPLGQFFKLSLIGSLAYNEYSRSDEADEALERVNDELGTSLDFVVPEDHLQAGATFEGFYNRRGYSIRARGSWFRRQDWGPWGVRESAVPGFGRLSADGDFVPEMDDRFEDSFRKWGVVMDKEWFLPHFQKIRGEIGYLDGSGFDRFSSYGFSFFGADRLSGFSGSGVQFDRGTIARAGYLFNVLEAIRFGARLERAWVVRNRVSDGTEVHTGLGLTANFVGPWKTLINFDYGYALKSDIPDLEGQQEFLLFIFKLF